MEPKTHWPPEQILALHGLLDNTPITFTPHYVILYDNDGAQTVTWHSASKLNLAPPTSTTPPINVSWHPSGFFNLSDSQDTTDTNAQP